MITPRVAITGLGLVCGAGLDLATSWPGVLAGRSPAKRFTLFDPTGLAVPFGIELPAGADELFARRIKPRHRSLMTRGTAIAVVTAEMAMADSDLDWERVDRTRVGVAVGTTGTGYVPPPSGADPHRILRNMSNSPASWVSLLRKLAGPSFIVSTACSSGAYALAAGHALVASGLCDVVVAGAADSSINALDVQGFASLMALAEHAEHPEQACKPFDRDRSGFVMGEGGGFLVLERLTAAKSRGARIYAEMPLPALTSEVYNILSPEPGGVGMATTMRQALEQAGLTPSDVDYVNAHGTSTQLNDLYEAQAIRSVFAEHATRLPISSTKTVTGHCLAAAAGIEAVLSCKALHEGVIPPTGNLASTDLELGLDFVPGAARPASLRHVMSNAFAFGGHNGVCVFAKPQ